MYGKGMTTRDISSHIKDIYGFGISETMVSKITNKILPTIEEWQNRPLEKNLSNGLFRRYTLPRKRKQYSSQKSSLHCPRLQPRRI